MALLNTIRGFTIFLCTVLACLCTGLNRDCLLIEHSQLLSLLNINTSNVTDTNIVCLSQGSQANTWTTISLVVSYNNSNLTQVQLACSNETWSVDSSSTADADLNTELRTDCSLCIDPGLHPNISNPQHCLECPDNCSRGLGRCSRSNECCNFFYNKTCVSECPNNTNPNNASICCADGFQGDNCTVDIDECIDQPCRNDAQCINTLGSYICVCNTGYSGPNCENDIDECVTAMPCQNNGICSNTLGGYNCTCTSGYIGMNCSTDIDECRVDNQCINNSTCVNTPGSYQCNCDPGFTGVNCEININDCNNVSCFNGGECFDGVDSFVCNCSLPWEGSQCEICPHTLSNGQCEIGLSLSSGAIGGIVVGVLAVIGIGIVVVSILIVAIYCKLRGKKLTQQQRQRQLFSDKDSSAHVFGNPMALESVADSGISIQGDEHLEVNQGALEFEEFESQP